MNGLVAPLAPGAGIGDRLARIDQLFAVLQGGPAGAAAANGGAAAPATGGGASSFASTLAGAQAAQAPSQGAGASGIMSSAAAPGGTSGSSTPFGAEIDAAAAKYGIDPSLLAGLVRQESGFDPGARSSAGALGLTQLMPSTAASLGVTNPLDPAQSLDGGARYLREQLDRFGGDVSKALAAYNAGPGAVERFGGVPPYPETQHYVRNILAFAGQAGAQVT